MANIVCECGSTFPLDRVNGMEKCPVCGKLWNDSVDSKTEDEHPGWITWYYYGHKRDNGKTTSLRDEAIDLKQFGDKFFLIKEFKAPPEAECGLDKVKDILRTYIPDAFVYKQEPENKVRCPRCRSTEIQLVPRKYRLLTGFATNKFDRMCVSCQKRF